MLPRFLQTPTPVIFGVPVHHRANSRCSILLILRGFGKPFFSDFLLMFTCVPKFVRRGQRYIDNKEVTKNKMEG